MFPWLGHWNHIYLTVCQQEEIGVLPSLVLLITISFALARSPWLILGRTTQFKCNMFFYFAFIRTFGCYSGPLILSPEPHWGLCSYYHFLFFCRSSWLPYCWIRCAALSALPGECGSVSCYSNLYISLSCSNICQSKCKNLPSKRETFRYARYIRCDFMNSYCSSYQTVTFGHWHLSLFIVFQYHNTCWSSIKFSM